MLHQKQSAVSHASSRRQPSSAYSEPSTLDPRIAAMRLLFRTLKRTVDTMRNHEDSLYEMRDVTSAACLRTELGGMRESVDAAFLLDTPSVYQCARSRYSTVEKFF